MKQKIRWGILGCANIARTRTIPGLLLADNAALYAAASRGIEKAKQLKKEFPDIKKIYGSYEELLEDPNVQAVYIPLPNTMHREWVEKAARKGKHILCEKPLAMSEEEAKEMYEICESEGVILMEAFAYRHAPLVQKVKRLINDGAIGKVKYIESHLTDVLADMGNIRMNSALGGGAFLDMGCYNISTISYLLDLAEPKKVRALAEMDAEYGVDTANTAILLYENGTQAAGYSSLNSYARGYYAVVGDKGRIEVPCNYNCRNIQKFTVTSCGHTSNVEIVDEKKTEYTVVCPDNYMLEIEQFGRCLLNGEKPLVSKEETLLNIRIMDRLRKEAERE